MRFKDVRAQARALVKKCGPNPGKCVYCRRHISFRVPQSHPRRATRDHVHPKSAGGKMTAWCCRQCNAIKSNMSVAEWRAYMKDNPRWWREDQSND